MGEREKEVEQEKRRGRALSCGLINMPFKNDKTKTQQKSVLLLFDDPKPILENEKITLGIWGLTSTD